VASARPDAKPSAIIPAVIASSVGERGAILALSPKPPILICRELDQSAPPIMTMPSPTSRNRDGDRRQHAHG